MALWNRNKDVVAPKRKSLFEFLSDNDYKRDSIGDPSKVYADASFVYEIVSGHAAAGSTLPLKILSIDAGNSQREEDLEHPAYQLLRKPNPSTSQATFIRGTLGWLALRGNAFWVKVRKLNGEIDSLELVRADFMRPVIVNGEIAKWQFVVGEEIKDEYPIDDVIHFRDWSSTSDFLGQSPVTAMRKEILLGTHAEDSAIDLFGNGAKFPGILYANPDMSDEDIDNAQKSFRAGVRSKRHSIPIIPKDDLEFVSVGMTPQDAEFINTAKMSRARVAAAFNWALPEDYPGQSPDAIYKARMIQSVHPQLVLIESTLELSLMDEWSDQPAFPEFQRNAIFEGDLPALATAYKDLVYGGIMPPEYAMKKLNIPTDVYARFIPMNMNRLLPDGTIDISPRVTENVVPPGQDVADQTATAASAQAQADSSGGMGGDQGQGGPSTGNGNAKGMDEFGLPLWSKAAVEPDRNKSYVEGRKELTAKQSKALAGRIRGVYKREAQSVKTVAGVKAMDARIPTIEELMRQSDAEISGLLKEFMGTTSLKAIKEAGKYVDATPDAAELESFFAARVPNAVKFLRGSGGTQTVTDLFSAASTGLDQRTLKNALEDYYGAAVNRAEGVARTEVAYSAEKSAVSAFKAAGATQVQFIRGNGPCSEGTCDDLDGEILDIDTEDAPPLHPSCECALAPYTTPLTAEGN